MRILFVTLGLIFTLSPYPQKVANQNPLVGNWKLVSSQAVYDNNGKPQDVLGPHPKGYLILTPEGRMMAVISSAGRKPGPSDAERAELWKSMIAYTGKYRIEGGDVVTTVDVSWNESWTGTDQRRHYKLEGNKLTLVTVPQPSPFFQGKTYSSTVVWEREK
ncbi:MAG: lipocalin-like domain-containing protein [Acidobacteriia bacterium]|nr:lipocalin-like domain-containing protein [Terriglobia bacterium]